ncbi:MAG: lytic transglycosylase domain-containing protein [Treponema sp.]|nr:lytic transglycosylase domain-containing protein [Treponema sp.]
MLNAAPEAGKAELEELSRIHPSAPFYAGLAVKAADIPRAADILFEKSLDSPNPLVREAAAGELLGAFFRGADMPGPLLERLKKEAPAPWKEAFALLARPEPREEVLAFILTGAPGDARQYVREELGLMEPAFFTAPEEAVMAGRFAVSQSAFAEGLQFFRTALEEGRSLFFRYPELLNDLGRCFQYAGAGDEGIDLFLSWEQDLAGSAAGNIPGHGGLYFRLLFFAGRIARQRGQLNRSVEYFSRALPFAPDALQEDACVWYILDTTLTADPDRGVSLAAAYIPRWNRPAYFTDVLDKIARYLVTKRRWEDMAALLTLMRKPGKGPAEPSVSGGAAQYAYILGRAIAEGYYTPAGRAGSEISRQGEAAALFSLAYGAERASLYYRALSAAALGEPLPVSSARPARAAPAGGDRAPLEFLRGFFEYGAAAFAFPYIEALGKELSAAEQRTLAEALEKAGLYPEAIRLTAACMEREDYEPVRADLERFYPRPFQKLIEKTARDTGLERATLFGLVRTESAFQPGVVSRAGAVGLTQLMPATAADMAGRIKAQGGPDYLEKGPPDLTGPEINVHIGAFYLSYLTGRLESPFLALLAYNGGMNRVRRWRSGEPELPGDLFLETIEYPETREYGRKVLAAALVYGYLYYDLKMGPFFSDMFNDR